MSDRPSPSRSEQVARACLAVEGLLGTGLLIWLGVLAGQWREAIPCTCLAALVPSFLCVVGIFGALAWALLVLLWLYPEEPS